MLGPRFLELFRKCVVMQRKIRFEGIIIAHLGNINGRKPERENQLPYLKAALKAGWHVCADVIFSNGAFLLPHIDGFHTAPPAFFSNQRVWSRCQDAETLDALCNIGAHALLATEAPLALTTSQFIWTLPPRELAQRSIAVYPELAAPNWLTPYEPAGLCSNSPQVYI